MLSLSITASSATSLNGGHVVVNTTPASAPRISVTATLPASVPAWQVPWAPPTTTSWAMMPAPAPAPPPTWTAAPAPWPTAPGSQPPPAWTTTAPLNLGLELFPGIRPPVFPLKGSQLGPQYRLTGGGILQQDAAAPPAPVLLQPRGKLGLLSCGPEQSPSTPLSFVLPGGLAAGALVQGLGLGLELPAQPEGAPETDLRLLQATTQALKTTGWYYEGFSWQESAATLRSALPGTFLVRDSSDPRFLFSLSVQTDRGPTSVRLLYTSAGFRLDAEPHLAPSMPLFPCVLQLVEHYVATGGKRRPAATPSSAPGTAPGTASGRGREQVWVDARGQMYSHILLTVPRRHTVPGLQHLARLAVNKQVRAAQVPAGSSLCHERVERLELPTTLRRYLEEYPYTL